VALISAVFAICASLAPTAGVTPNPELHLATFNIAHGRGLANEQVGHTKETYEANIDAVSAVIKRENPDILALQEADAPSVWSGLFDHVARVVQATGYQHVHHGIHMDVGGWGMQARYGTALLSHLTLSDRQSFNFTPQGLHRKGFVTATVEFAGEQLTVVSLHLDSQSVPARESQVDVMVQALAGRNMPLIVMGDFNSRWENEKDAVRQIAQRLDLSAYKPESRELLTYHTTRLNKRIDWILISSELEFTTYAVWPDQVSDHLGVAARVRWRKPH